MQPPEIAKLTLRTHRYQTYPPMGVALYMYRLFPTARVEALIFWARSMLSGTGRFCVAGLGFPPPPIAGKYFGSINIPPSLDPATCPGYFFSPGTSFGDGFTDRGLSMRGRQVTGDFAHGMRAGRVWRVGLGGRWGPRLNPPQGVNLTSDYS